MMDKRRHNAPNDSTLSAPAAHALHDDACVDLLREAVDAEPGIVEVNLDTENSTVSFGYDPALVAQPRLDEIAHELAPTIQQRLETCTLRVGQVGGRACESCAVGLERRMSRVPGVRSASASYRGGVLSVTYDGALISPAAIADRVQKYGVRLDEVPSYGTEDEEADEQPRTLPRRVADWLTSDKLEAIFTGITLVAMMLALGIDNWAGPSGAGVASALYAVAYVTGGSFGLKAGVESLSHGTIDIDLLMVLAALGAAFVGSPFEGAMLLFLFSLSNVLQAYALDRTRNAIKALMKLRPKQALVKRGDTTVVLPIERVMVGDCIVVKPGERIALDGMVSAGESTVDQASITGESMPVSKCVGDTVFAGTINKNGSLDVGVTKLAKDSTIAQLIKMVEEAHSQKAQTQRFIDKFGQYYAVAVILITALAIVIPIFVLSEAFHSAFYRAMTVMVAMSPCALVISTPASILSAIGNGARRGVLFKGGVHLEQAATIKVVAFDKTGTLTEGKPKVTDVIVAPSASLTKDELIALAAAVQSKSEHPLARATLSAAAEHHAQVSEAFAFQATTGKGVRGLVDGRDIRIGNLRYFEGFSCVGLHEIERDVLRLEREGKTSVAVGELGDDGETATMLGVIAFADLLRPNVARIVREIKAAGVERVVMLTGDNKHTAEAIARQAGLDDFYAELLPEDKVRVVREIGEKYGPVAMVGDGVNDAPALATARLGIAMGAAGTDVALETADVVLMGDDIGHIPYLIALSKQTRRTLVTNIGFAMFMIAVMLLAIFSIQLPLPLAVVGHEGGTVLVSLNGLRLLGYKYRPLPTA
ncbi:MAG: cation-translocating P-type ATPase [Chloroflexota bacterium]